MPTYTPIILTAGFEPSPAAQGQTVTLYVVAVDVATGEKNEARYSGEFAAGEV